LQWTGRVLVCSGQGGCLFAVDREGGNLQWAGRVLLSTELTVMLLLLSCGLWAEGSGDGAFLSAHCSGQRGWVLPLQSACQSCVPRGGWHERAETCSTAHAAQVPWAGGSGIWWGEGDCGRLADRWRMALGNACLDGAPQKKRTDHHPSRIPPPKSKHQHHAHTSVSREFGYMY